MRRGWLLLVVTAAAASCGGAKADHPVGLDAAPPLDVGSSWVAVPAGNFQMGCRQQDPFCDLDESPLHEVNVRAFELTATLTTQAQYLAATGATPSVHADCGEGCPVENVSWFDAQAFCRAVGGRLPTEAEYEYAARARVTTPFICGDDPACLDAAAWYNLNAGGVTHPVAQKAANGFGLFDMTGNVWEWTEDCYHVTYDGAPSDGRAWANDGCASRVLHGSAFDIWLDGNLRLWARVPEAPDRTERYMGFRCARSK